MMVFWVFMAGGLGSAARYLVGLWAVATLGAGFPYGTLIVNLAGSFALGLVAQLALAGSWPLDMRAAIAAGLLGGFTTYSSFNQETLTMLAGGAAGAAALYVTVTLVGGLAAGALGMLAARQF